MTDDEKRKLYVRAQARKWASYIRDEGYGFAHTIPDHIVDALSNEELKYFQECLPQFRVVRREDWKWEARP